MRISAGERVRGAETGTTGSTKGRATRGLLFSAAKERMMKIDACETDALMDVATRPPQTRARGDGR